MPTYVMIHGAGDSAFAWHLVAPELRERGHDVVTVDLPCDKDGAGLAEYTDTVLAAIGDRRDLVVVAHSYGGFIAPLVCARVRVELLILVAAMIPRPGERGDDWFANTGLVSQHGDEDLFYHDVPPAIAAEARRHERRQSARPGREPWPLGAWPDVPTRFLLCRDDRLFAAAWMRRIVRSRLGMVADEIDGGHCIMLARPRELVERLEAYCTEPHRVRLADAFDKEVQVHGERLLSAASIRPGEHVVDIGCGTGRITRDAAAAATPGRVLGLDISAAMLAHARRLTLVDNVTYELGDAQVYPFPAGAFDIAISRFGTMFFADPSIAFANIVHALRPGGRLVMLVWRRRELNPWADFWDLSTFDPFSLGDADTTRSLLERAGFCEIRFIDVDDPVNYGRDADAALALVRGDPSMHPRLARHQREDGVWLDARAWLVTAKRQ
jgi:SAM-dependent methyltransferase